jgi:hypothetical protein
MLAAFKVDQADLFDSDSANRQQQLLELKTLYSAAVYAETWPGGQGLRAVQTMGAVRAACEAEWKAMNVRSS